ncbi:hypothetical protein ACNSOL_00260 [Aliarcobacter lanthieri]|uniref:hypothetical protein n=1 Tax=Aliarcobacter lanthieri TaxID=1355374 RepID=UPI003AAB1D8E
MKIKKILFVLISSVFILTGCGSKIFMPYEEEPLCNAGKGSGYCGSVSDVYEAKIKEQKWR